MGVLEQLYFQSPPLCQNVLMTAMGWRTNRLRYGGAFRERFREYVQRLTFDEEQIASFRQRRLEETLRLASEAPYYKELFAAEGCSWRDLTDPAAYRQFPLTHKSEVQSSTEAFRPRPRARGDNTIRTSGTTGSAVTIHKSSNAISEQWAVWWRYRGLHGLDRSTPLALFAGRPVIPAAATMPYWRINLAARETRFSSYHLSPDTIGFYVDELRRSRTPWIHGFASAINNLATLMNDAGLSLGYKLKAVTLGGENVTSWHRENIQAALGVDPVQHYGLAEGVANVSQCRLGRLHVDEDFSYVEFAPNPPGTALQIVGTNFGNDAMVLLRYATDDLVSVDTERCPCGRWGRILSSLDGRNDDTIVLPDGRIVGTVEDAFRDVLGIAEAQITQLKDGSLRVRYVKGLGHSPTTARDLTSSLRRFLGEDIEVRVDRVARVPRTTAGKVRLVVSELDK